MSFLAQQHNPVAQRELNYQQRAANALGTLRLQWVYRVVYYPALALALLVFLSELGAAVQPGEEHSAALVLNVIVIFALVVALLMHLYLLLQTLIRAATSIAREKQAGTWEDLLMTGTDARRLVVGKWWATLRGLLGGYGLLIPLRAGVVVWLGAVFDRTQALHIESVSDFVAPGPLAFLGTFPVIAAFTLGSALMVAAVSVLASILCRRMVEALALALTLTVLVLVGTFAALAVLPRLVIDDSIVAAEWRDVASPFAENVLLTWLDNGMSLTSELVNYQTEYETPSPQFVADQYASRKTVVWLLTFTTCIGLYGLLTWGTLRVAQGIAVRQGALPPAGRRSSSHFQRPELRKEPPCYRPKPAGANHA
jgi:ABC-type transport system involved in multi-copper enzyme maturation permease subunit